MAGMFAPTIETSLQGASPSNVTVGSATGASIAVDAFTGLAGGLLNQYASEQGSGGSGDSEARLRRESLEQVSRDLQVASSLRDQGRGREAEVVTSRALARHVSSWGVSEELDEVSRLFTGRTVMLNTRSPEQAMVEDMMASPDFIEKALPAAYGFLAQSGGDLSSESVQNTALTILMQDRTNTAQLAFGKNRDETWWQTYGRPAAIEKLQNFKSGLLGRMEGLRGQGIKVTAEMIVAAKQELALLSSQLSAAMPFGVTDGSFDKSVTATQEFLTRLEKAPEDFINQMGVQGMAAFLQASDGTVGETLIANAVISNPSQVLTMTGDTFLSAIQNIRDLPTFNGSFRYSFQGEGSAPQVGTPSYSDIFPDQIDGVPVSGLSNKEVTEKFTGSMQLLSTIDVKKVSSDPDTMKGVQTIFTSVGAIMSHENLARLSPETVQKYVTPNVISALKTIEIADPDLYNTVRTQFATGLNKHREAWERRTNAIARESIFAVDKNGSVVPSMERMKERLGSGITPVMRLIEKTYGGDIDAFFNDGGRKARGEDAFPLISRYVDEYQQIRKFASATMWANQTLKTIGVATNAGFSEQSGEPRRVRVKFEDLN